MSTVPERSIGLLRGINVGRAKRVAMAELREIVAGLGYRDVSTLLQSGNVLFAAAKGARGGATAARRIEEALLERLGVSARVTVIEAAELADALDEDPFASLDVDPSKSLLGVLARVDDGQRLAPLTERTWGDDRIALRGRFVYLACPNGIHTSKLAIQVDRTLRDACTTRNRTTLTKLLALARTAEPRITK